MLLKCNYFFDLRLIFSIESLCLETNVGEVDEVFGSGDGLSLLSGDQKHSESLSDAPGDKQEFFVYFNEGDVKNDG